MNRNLLPKYVSKFLTLFVLVSGLVFLLSNKTMGVDYEEFDRCMVSAHGQFDSCLFASYVNRDNCYTSCGSSSTCQTNCDNTMVSAQDQCDLNYNGQIWTNSPTNCAGFSVPNHKAIERRCRLESSRVYNACMRDPVLGCFNDEKPDENCCGRMETDQIQSCLYP